MTNNKIIPYPNFTPTQDGRFKIHPRDHKKVRAMYKKLKSTRKTGAFFGVTKGTISNIVNPEQYKAKQLKRYAKKPWLEEYAKYQGEKWNKIMRIHKRKKYELQGEALREYRHSRRGKTFEPRVCETCGVEYLPHITTQRFCSRKCFEKAWRERRKLTK